MRSMAKSNSWWMAQDVGRRNGRVRHAQVQPAEQSEVRCQRALAAA
jgi:hypothetical protein